MTHGWVTDDDKREEPEKSTKSFWRSIIPRRSEKDAALTEPAAPSDDDDEIITQYPWESRTRDNAETWSWTNPADPLRMYNKDVIDEDPALNNIDADAFWQTYAGATVPPQPSEEASDIWTDANEWGSAWFGQHEPEQEPEQSDRDMPEILRKLPNNEADSQWLEDLIHPELRTADDRTQESSGDDYDYDAYDHANATVAYPSWNEPEMEAFPSAYDDSGQASVHEESGISEASSEQSVEAYGELQSEVAFAPHVEIVEEPAPATPHRRFSFSLPDDEELASSSSSVDGFEVGGHFATAPEPVAPEPVARSGSRFRDDPEDLVESPARASHFRDDDNALDEEVIPAIGDEAEEDVLPVAVVDHTGQSETSPLLAGDLMEVELVDPAPPAAPSTLPEAQSLPVWPEFDRRAQSDPNQSLRRRASDFATEPEVEYPASEPVHEETPVESEQAIAPPVQSVGYIGLPPAGVEDDAFDLASNNGHVIPRADVPSSPPSSPTLPPSAPNPQASIPPPEPFTIPPPITPPAFASSSDAAPAAPSTPHTNDEPDTGAIFGSEWDLLRASLQQAAQTKPPYDDAGEQDDVDPHAAFVKPPKLAQPIAPDLHVGDLDVESIDVFRREQPDAQQQPSQVQHAPLTRAQWAVEHEVPEVDDWWTAGVPSTGSTADGPQALPWWEIDSQNAASAVAPAHSPPPMQPVASQDQFDHDWASWANTQESSAHATSVNDDDSYDDLGFRSSNFNLDIHNQSVGSPRQPSDHDFVADHPEHWPAAGESEPYSAGSDSQWWDRQFTPPLQTPSDQRSIPIQPPYDPYGDPYAQYAGYDQHQAQGPPTQDRYMQYDEYNDYEMPYEEAPQRQPRPRRQPANDHRNGYDPYEDEYDAQEDWRRESSRSDRRSYDEADDWGFDDDDDYDLRSSRAPASRKGKSHPEPTRGRRPGARSKPKRRKDDEEQTNSINIFAVIAIIIVFIIVILVAKSLFSNANANAQSQNSLGTQTCAGLHAARSTPPIKNLQSMMVGPPDGWQTAPDYSAQTGPIDTTRALKLELNPTGALATLDQSRFVSGFDREFVGPKQATMRATVYQFPSAACADVYLGAHRGEPALSLDTKDVSASQGARGAFASIAHAGDITQKRIYVAKDNFVIVVAWQGEPNAKFAPTAVTLARSQIGRVTRTS